MIESKDKGLPLLVPIEFDDNDPNNPKYVEENLNNNYEQSCNTCSNMCCKVPNNEKIGYEDDGKPAGYYCLGYQPPKKHHIKRKIFIKKKRLQK